MTMAPFTPVPHAGNVLFQFLSRYDSMRAVENQSRKTTDLLFTLLNVQNKPSLHITGHGLGAVLATMLALDVVGNNMSQGVIVYTFSSPKLGDTGFASKYDELVPDTWRVASLSDPITNLPSASFEHVKTSYALSPQGGGAGKENIPCQQSLQMYLHTLDSNEPLDRECQSSLTDNLVAFYQHNHQASWFWPISVTASAVCAYIVCLMALLLLASQKGSTVFSRTWLIARASKPLLAVPGLGRHVLFLGYKKRLFKQKAVVQVSFDYFGLPADPPSGEPILPDTTGNSLHDRIAQAVGPQQPVLIIGTGGAGKSTLLARFALLALRENLAKPLQNYLPVIVPASYYTGSLVAAITDALREHDGVAVTQETVTAQLQSGRFLILFDGVSEVASENKLLSWQDIVRTCTNFDYKESRFILATRPIEGFSGDLPQFHLRPLNPEIISVLLPRYHLPTAGENYVRLQLQSLGPGPVEPLLLAMILTQSARKEIRATRASLFEAYFRRLLQADSDQDLWDGWRVALETLAQWFLLDTGKSGIGLPHGVLIDRIMGVTNDAKQHENLLTTLKRLYHFPATDGLDFVRRAEAAGLLVRERRWRFAHDTFEEYFAASRLVSIFEETGSWPALVVWIGYPQQEKEFLDVLKYVREMAADVAIKGLNEPHLPEAWKEQLS